MSLSWETPRVTATPDMQRSIGTLCAKLCMGKFLSQKPINDVSYGTKQT